MEFTEFKPDVSILFPRHAVILNLLKGEWLATGIESGSKFTAIELTEGEWFDYDEKAGEEVSIKDLKWEIRRN